MISRQHAPARVELVLRDQDFRKALRFADISRKPPAGELLSQQDFAVGAYDEAKYSGAYTRPLTDVVNT